MKKLFTLLLSMALAMTVLQTNAAKIFINSSNPNSTYVYVWGATDGETLGAWPGKRVNVSPFTQTVVDGTTYYVVELTSGNVIFNNNNGQQVNFSESLIEYSEIYVRYPYGNNADTRFKSYNVTKKVESGVTEDPAILYLVGSFNNWAQKDANYQFTLDSSTGTYTLSDVAFSSTETVKFMSDKSKWYGTQSGIVAAEPGNTYSMMEGGNDNNFQLQPGTYTFTVDLANLSLTLSGTATPEDPSQFTYSIAGNDSEIFGESWAPANTSTEMTLNTETGLYEWTSGEFTVTDEARQIQFKVVRDHAWTVSYPANNVNITAPIGGPYTLTVTFDADSKEVNAELNSETVITNTYSVAGSDATLFGASWSATETSTEMTEGESGVYSWTSGNFNQAADGFIEFKVIENHSWDSAYPSGDNQYVFVPAGGPYTLTVTYNTNGNAVSGTVNGADAAYSVVGGSTDILGGDWNVKNLSTKMTPGTDGLYRWTSAEFNQAEDGSISFKVAKNFSWGEAYPADNYNLNLPAGGPYTLTVTFNPNGNAVGAALNGAHTYVVAGEPVEAFGSEWDINDTNNALVHQGNGIYTLNVTYKPASSNSAPAKGQNVRKRAEGDMTTIKFKVVEDGNWDNAYPADNYTMEVPTDQKSNIAITFDAASKGISATSEIATGVNDLNADKAVAGVKYYNLLGVESAEPFQGVNVVVTTYADGSKQATKVVR